MSCLLFKLSFTAPVHFGPSNSALSLLSSEENFCADTLFSALCHTALHAEGVSGIDRLCSAARDGRLRLSDSMPWRGEELYLPKPYVSAENRQETPAALRKALKKLRWIPVSAFDAFSESIRGGAQYVPSDTERFGILEEQTRAALSEGADAVPYQVGMFKFFEDCGLWFICICENVDEEWMVSLVRSLGYSGIGGKISSGMGAFRIEDMVYLDEPFDGQTEWLSTALTREAERYLLLTAALPTDGELEDVMTEASYQLIRRGGFVQSETYSAEAMKKDTQFYLAAGSVLRKRFSGALYEVGSGGAHAVYRYSKPIFLGVTL